LAVFAILQTPLNHENAQLDLRISRTLSGTYTSLSILAVYDYRVFAPGFGRHAPKNRPAVEYYLNRFFDSPVKHQDVTGAQVHNLLKSERNRSQLGVHTNPALLQLPQNSVGDSIAGEFCASAPIFADDRLELVAKYYGASLCPCVGIGCVRFCEFQSKLAEFLRAV
jgi:hypothetical protein